MSRVEDKIKGRKNEWRCPSEPSGNKSKLTAYFMCMDPSNNVLTLIAEDFKKFFNAIGMTKGSKGEIATVVQNVKIEDMGSMMVEYFSKGGS